MEGENRAALQPSKSLPSLPLTTYPLTLSPFLQRNNIKLITSSYLCIHLLPTIISPLLLEMIDYAICALVMKLKVRHVLVLERSLYNPIRDKFMSLFEDVKRHLSIFGQVSPLSLLLLTTYPLTLSPLLAKE